jgi:hypothetical protein
VAGGGHAWFRELARKNGSKYRYNGSAHANEPMPGVAEHTAKLTNEQWPNYLKLKQLASIDLAALFALIRQKYNQQYKPF